MPRDALLIVDVQNDFCPGGTLAVEHGDRVVPVLNEYAKRFAQRGARIYASRDWHPLVTRHFRAHGGPWPPHCVQDTPGAEFHPELSLPPGTTIVTKGMDPEDHGYSAFEGVTSDGRTLADALRAAGIERVFIGGLTTDYCVRTTTLDAAREGFEPVVLLDAVRGINVQPGDVDRALTEMQRAGARMATREQLDQLLSDDRAWATRT